MTGALRLADRGRVTVLHKGEAGLTNTSWAQGGIAAVWDEYNDSVAVHTADTVEAGANLSQPEVVSEILSEGKQAVQQLIDWGVKFDRAREGGDYDLTLEGGHHARRILHTQDITGAEIQRALQARVQAHPNISFLPGKVAVDLITERSIAKHAAQKRLGISREIEPCYGPAGPEQWTDGRADRCFGAYVLDESSGEVDTFTASSVLLATGGAGKTYLYTSNPDSATGDGMALAWKAGATVSGMEFVQFHPTCVRSERIKTFLVSEALRGEGGILRLPKTGAAFMDGVHPLKNLAPRDIVAREIDKMIKRHGLEAVHLDMTHLDASYLTGRFPGIHKVLCAGGIDMTREPIPVVPACHYFCGGVRVDQHGRTGIDGLLAAGEVTSTGLHGANRLASNSLLEGAIYGLRAAEVMAGELGARAPPPGVDQWDSGAARDPDELAIINATWDEIRRLMWNYVGIVRTDRRLHRALSRLEFLRAEVQRYYWDFRLTRDLVELRNIITVAELVVRSAIARRESRGCSYNLDCPDLDPAQARDIELRRDWTKYY